MRQIAEEKQLPADIEAEPLVRAAAALQPVIRSHRDEIDREQRLPKTLVEQFHAAGFYNMTIPRELGGRQVDPLTYLRVVELLAEAAGSVGWNLCNNSIAQLVTLGLPDEGVQELYSQRPDTPIAGTAVMGGGRAVAVEGGYRVTGRWPFGTGCQEASWMLGSFQILDGGEPRRSPDGGSSYWRGIFKRSEARVVDGSWDVAGLRATGSFDWTVEDVFLPERRTMVHAGIPLDNQWSRWPGISYALPAQAWVGPHHSAVITGICRAGINAMIELAGAKTPRGRSERLCDNPQVQDAIGRALEHRRGRRGDHARAARALPDGRGQRRRQRAHGDGPGLSPGREHVVQAREPAGRVLARSPRGRPGGHDHAGVVPDRRAGPDEHGPRPADALAGPSREASPPCPSRSSA